MWQKQGRAEGRKSANSVRWERPLSHRLLATQEREGLLWAVWGHGCLGWVPSADLEMTAGSSEAAPAAVWEVGEVVRDGVCLPRSRR